MLSALRPLCVCHSMSHAGLPLRSFVVRAERAGGARLGRTLLVDLGSQIRGLSPFHFSVREGVRNAVGSARASASGVYLYGHPSETVDVMTLYTDSITRCYSHMIIRFEV